MDVDVSRLAIIGAEIAGLGEKLKTLRVQRDEVQKEISELESKLTPLVLEHSKIIASLVGQPLAPPPPPPHVNGETYGPPNGPNGPSIALPAFKARILRYLDNAEPGTSAQDVATALQIDATIVRNVMRELRERGTFGGAG